MTAPGSFRRNVFTNWLVLGSSIGSALLLTPVVVRALAGEQYGVWSFLNGLMSYTELLYLGLGSALVRSVARFRATRDSAGINRLVSVVASIYALIGILCLGGTALLSPYITHIFAEPLSAEASRAASIATVLLGVQLFAVFLSSAFSGLLAAHDRYDLVDTVAFVSVLFRSVAIAFLVRPGHNPMVTLAVLMAVVTTASTLMLGGISYWYVPGLSVRLTRPRIDELKLLYGFGLQSFLIVFAVKLISYTDTTVIGSMLGAASVALYVLPLQLIEYSRTGVGAISRVLLPRLTVLVTNGEMERVRQAFLEATRMSACLSGWVAATLVAVGPAFLNRWVGPEFGTPVQLVLIYLVIAAFAQMMSAQVPFPFYQALGIVGFPAAVLMCEAVVNLGFSIWLAPKLGIAGVALATAVPAVCVGFLILPPFICRRIGLSYKIFVVSALLPGVMTGVVTALVSWFVAQYIEVVTYVGIAARTVVTVPFGLLLFFAWMPKAQKRAVLNAMKTATNYGAVRVWIKNAAPDWLLALAFRLGRRLDPAIARRSSLMMCCSPTVHQTSLPPRYAIDSIVSTRPPAGWREALGSAGLKVSDDDWARDFSDPTRADVLALTYNGAIVGTAGVKWEPGRRAGLVTWVGVRAEYQGHGLSKPLVAGCLNKSVAVGLKTVYLMTDDHRLPAIKAYLGAGFQPCLKSQDWTHRPRWRTILRALRIGVHDCGESSHSLGSLAG
jgi:O-antigen/teichoic acid export membrane protein/GNAT superfamily N-acetyltransferase